MDRLRKSEHPSSTASKGLDLVEFKISGSETLLLEAIQKALDDDRVQIFSNQRPYMETIIKGKQGKTSKLVL